ncbi:MAG: peptidase C1 [Bacteroidetes bacterium]|nr:peptidase C1 [Bacteroidota bacterium]MBU1720455.1 peptidase C1 [Bacteroidota bacterium]
MRKLLLHFFALIVISGVSSAQNQNDSSKFIEQAPGYFQNVILKGIETFDSPQVQTKRRTYFTMDMSQVVHPANPEECNPIWHNMPESQGYSGTCWCFSATSFFESEIKRLNNKEVALSEMYIVYWEYVERARRFVEERGNSYFDEGSETNGAIRMAKMYGMVPFSAYSGLLKGQTVINHSKMIEELKQFLNKVKETSAWDQEWAISVVQSILNKYMGKPPVEFTFEGTKYTPATFRDNYLQFKPGDYYVFLSFTSDTYYQRTELREADNWWKSDDYYNVPLDDFMKLIDEAIKKGFTISLCGDVSEAGLSRFDEIAVVPSFDIPAENIDASARQLRWENKSTTDDHCIHIVGMKELENGKWYLIKDSSSGAFDGPNKGYLFFHEDYIKLKMVNFMVHKDAARFVLDKCIK